MQLFIDSADPDQIRQAWNWGIVNGVTTNPSLAAKVGRPYPEIVHQIFEIVDQNATVSLEVAATDLEGILEQARSLAKLSDKVVVKVPCTPTGIKATSILSAEGILVNVTLVFSVSQALLAAKAGAFYISPFVGRMNDLEVGSGFRLAEQIVEMVSNYGFESQVLYASVRDQTYVEHAARIGADIVTAPFAVLESMFQHHLTDAGLEKFLKDWHEANLDFPT